MAVGQEGPWLVKSGGRIMGPYSKGQLEQLLKTREFVVLDEISQPFRRWHCIKDVPTFAKIVEELRVQNLKFGGDDTVSTTMDATGTITVTDPNDDFGFDETTDNIGNFQKSMGEIVYDDVSDGYDVKTEHTAPGGVKSFGYQNDTLIAKQAQATARLAWLVTGAILFGVVAFIIYNRFVSQPMAKKGSATEVKNQAMEALEAGDYAVALDRFQKANRLNPSDKDLFTYLGTLQVQIGKQTVEGRRKLQEVVATGKGVFPMRAMTAIGIADLIDGESRTADEHFKKALAQDTYYAPAKINLGASALQRKESQVAREWLSSVVEQGTEDGAAHLMLAEANINLYQEEQQKTFLEQGQKQLTKLMQTSRDYYQEAALMLAYMDFVAGDLEGVMRKVELVLDVDPQMTDDHRHDLFVYRGRIGWDVLSKLCVKMALGIEQTARVKALRGYCQFKAGSEIEALKWVDDAAAQGTKDPLVQAVYAFVLDGVGQETRASVALNKANELNKKMKLALPVLLQARFNARANKPAQALKLWQELYAIDDKSVVGLTGIAQSHFDMKNYSEAQSFLFDGFRLSRAYRPLIRLKKEAEREGLLPKDNF
ncbi:MAG: hypothetical protein IT288_05870 [Bdellovibrionales bacterium]|nr:hypothetical protein [Bdellovibrionales bacterium]